MQHFLSKLPSVAVYFLFIVNIHLLTNVIVKTRKFTRLSWMLTALYLTTAIAYTYYPNIIFNVFTLYLLLFAIMLSVHRDSKFMTLYITLIYLLTDSVISPLLTLLIKAMPFPISNTELLLKSISLVLNLITLCVVLYLRKHHKSGIRYSVKLLPKKIYSLLIVSLALLGTLCVVETLIEEKKNEIPVEISDRVMSVLIALTVLSSLVVMIFMLMNCISKFYFESTSQLLNKQVNIQLEHYEKIEQINRDVREFRHDYRNHMICLHTLLKNNETSKAMDYLCSITDHTIRSLRSFRSGNSVADAILNDKCGNARAHNCDIQFNGVISDRISAFDICTILSNALDNSIEACQRLPESEEVRIISVDCSVDGCIQLIQVKNPSVSEDSNHKTSKADKENHGFGLYNIRRTVKALNGRVNIPSTSPEFILQIELMIPEKAVPVPENPDVQEDEGFDLKQLRHI